MDGGYIFVALAPAPIYTRRRRSASKSHHHRRPRQGDPDSASSHRSSSSSSSTTSTAATATATALTSKSPRLPHIAANRSENHSRTSNLAHESHHFQPPYCSEPSTSASSKAESNVAQPATAPTSSTHNFRRFRHKRTSSHGESNQSEANEHSSSALPRSNSASTQLPVKSHSITLSQQGGQEEPEAPEEREEREEPDEGCVALQLQPIQNQRLHFRSSRTDSDQLSKVTTASTSASSSSVGGGPTSTLASLPSTNTRASSTASNQHLGVVARGTVAAGAPAKPNSQPFSSQPRYHAKGASVSDVRSTNPYLVQQSDGSFFTRFAPSMSKLAINNTIGRADSASSHSAATVNTSRQSVRSEDAHNNSRSDVSCGRKPFITLHGRTWINDATLAYPFPVDLTEMHRQSLRTMLTIQLFGAPVFNPSLRTHPPRRVLDVACGSGFWSMMCHRYYKDKGAPNVSFVGIDISPLAYGSSSGQSYAPKPDQDMNWQFFQHDLRQVPWPFPDGHFDLIMCREMSMVATNQDYGFFMDEYIRLLRPNGILEVWDADHAIRMLRPHVPDADPPGGPELEEHRRITRLGAYHLTANTPLSVPVNPFILEYNAWLGHDFDSRHLSAVPCTVIGPTLIQEYEALTDIRSRRLAIPLSEVRWEREGVGGVITKDGKSDAKKGHARAPSQRPVVEKKTLTTAQAALRSTALLTVIQQIQALETKLRQGSGKSLDEWDTWMEKMTTDLWQDGGTSLGECLEIGVWCAKKKKG